jgi:hypothetical protein
MTPWATTCLAQCNWDHQTKNAFLIYMYDLAKASTEQDLFPSLPGNGLRRFYINPATPLRSVVVPG